MNEQKLLPCPFCGGEAEVKEVNAGEEPDINFIVVCDCGAEIGFCKKKKAIKLWNTRAQQGDYHEGLNDITRAHSNPWIDIKYGMPKCKVYPTNLREVFVYVSGVVVKAEYSEESESFFGQFGEVIKGVKFWKYNDYPQPPKEV